MNALAILQFEGQVVRISDRDGLLWFVARDVCQALELANDTMALRRLPENEKGVISIDPLAGRGGVQQMNIISEPGMYRLVMTSRKPSAQRFQDWVVGEVLPSIRRTGSYNMPMPANDQAESSFADLFDGSAGQRAIITKLAFLRAAGQTFGNPAAQEAWRIARLPDVSPESSYLYLPEQDAGIVRWLEDRVEFTPQRDTPLLEMFNDYVNWCRWFGGETPRDKSQFRQHLRLHCTGGIGGKSVMVTGVELKPAKSMLTEGGDNFRYQFKRSSGT